MNKGLFITLEGGEGVGKSTQAKRLADDLGAAGHTVLLTREPGGTDSAEAIRTLVKNPPSALTPMAETLLFAAARADHVEQVIKPALAQGYIVICDRFTDSTRAYQAAGHGVAITDILVLERLACGDLQPDLTLIFDLDPADGLSRAETRGPTDSIEQRSTDYHNRLRQAFLDIAKDDPARCHVINASQDIDAITQQVLAIIESRLT